MNPLRLIGAALLCVGGVLLFKAKGTTIEGASSIGKPNDTDTTATAGNSDGGIDNPGPVASAADQVDNPDA